MDFFCWSLANLGHFFHENPFIGWNHTFQLIFQQNFASWQQPKKNPMTFIQSVFFGGKPKVVIFQGIVF